MNGAPVIVSSDQEELILVNARDESIGTMSKRDCHQGEGTLHRAFSIFIFNAAEAVLLQQRSGQKLLWPDYWSNACCSHPQVGEDCEVAANRRLQQELGITLPLTFIYKFEYRAQYENAGSEHELCWVWVGFAEAEEINPNSNEIADWRFFSREELNRELADNPGRYTPWMKLEWEHLLAEYAARLVP